MKNRNKGFSIIEMLIAIGLFSVVTSIAVGGFAQALRTQRQAALLMSVNSNISQALEIMAREIRTGVSFTRQAGQSSGFGFTNAKGETVIYIVRNGALVRLAGSLFQGVLQGGEITGSNVRITNSRFDVQGTNNEDGFPPRITIALRAQANTTDAALNSSAIDIQTTVSARLMDDDPPGLWVRKQVNNPGGGGSGPESFAMVVVGDYVRPCLTPEEYVNTSGKTKQEKEKESQNIIEYMHSTGSVCHAFFASNPSPSICLFRGSATGTEVTLAEGPYCVDELYESFYKKDFDRDCAIQKPPNTRYDSAKVNERRTCDVINTRE